MNPKLDRQKPLFKLMILLLLWNATSRVTFHAQINSQQHTSIEVFIHGSFHQLTGNGMNYLIIDKISNTIEKEIVWPLEDIFWPFIRKCAIKGIWLQRNEIISATLTQRKQQRKKAIKKSHNIGDFNEQNTASLKFNKRNKIGGYHYWNGSKAKQLSYVNASL